MNGTPENEDDAGDMIPFRSDDPADETPGDETSAGEELGGEASGSQASGDERSGAEPGRAAGPQPGAGSRAEPGAESGVGAEAGVGTGAERVPESGDAREPDSAPTAEGASESGSGPEQVAGQGAAEGVEALGQRGRAMRKAGLVTAGLVVAVLVLGAGAVAVLKPRLSPDDFEGTGSGTVTVRITPGSSAEAIGSTLAEAGVVASAEAFVNASEDRGVTSRLRPGHYRLRKGMAAGAALDLLLAPTSRIVRRVTVPEGMRTSEVLNRLTKQTGMPLKEFQSVDKALVGLPAYAPGLEGFLFPATYEVEPGDTAVDVLAAMAERFAVAARHVDLEEQAARLRLTPLEIVTVASMIQAEGGTDEDYPKISRVIYNRLEKGTPLEIDSTVLYAQNRRTLRVTEKDTKVDSPYNTYRHKGLPPGPIANPGEKALMAALNPADGDWHWFVTTDPAHRITKFTNKESEFVRYREELNKNLGTR
ncbi:UPF0755 protein [Nonomuraea jiangxiensis]|uniref:Endolytic murein transglycosylase n=1 Tax=Nonomuraea jiangxiensis TaxID=633440 RepID=A0A1G9M484_9ACTN|nr:UPF0755 protein [Nonomuraea jiangxiensis]